MTETILDLPLTPVVSGESKPTIIKYGKGKKAVPMFAVTKGCGLYTLAHIPSNSYLSRYYYYLSACRFLSAEVIEVMGDKLLEPNRELLSASFPVSLKDYVLFYSAKDVKQPQTYEEFLNGPDYEAVILERNSNSVRSLEEDKHHQELLEGGASLGWVPK